MQQEMSGIAGITVFCLDEYQADVLNKKPYLTYLPTVCFLTARERNGADADRGCLSALRCLYCFFILFYCTPEFIANDTGRLFIYMLLMYILTGTLDSLVNANYGALFPELFKEDELRAKTYGFRQICQLFAMAISIALTPMITDLGYIVFDTPGGYIKNHAPIGHMDFTQDTADGNFTGFSSWAEKPYNRKIWTAVERSRALSRAFSVSDEGSPSFNDRLLLLSTTHFGLATPVLRRKAFSR